jgi:hypothetical protein
VARFFQQAGKWWIVTATVQLRCGLIMMALLGAMLGGCDSGDPTSTAASAAGSTAGTPPPTTANVTSVTLTWTTPTVNANGTPASDLAGYHIYYGTSAASLTTVITVDNPGDTSQVIGNLTAGTWYFAVASFNSDNIDSALSGILPVAI